MNELLKKCAESGVMPVVIGIMGFGLLFSIALIYKPQKVVIKGYYRISNSLIQTNRRNFFDYQRIKSSLIKSGIAFHHPIFNDPIIFVGTKLCIGAVLSLLGLRIHFIASIVLLFLGYKLLDIYGMYLTRQDNKKMQPDLQLVYNSLAVQIRGGVYVVDALCENYESVENPRLKLAFMEMSGDILLNADFKTSIKEFQSKFDNRYVDSLCITLTQSMESGQAVDLLADIAEQLKELQANELLKKKQEMDRVMTFTQVALFGDVVLFILYLSMKMLVSAISNF